MNNQLREGPLSCFDLLPLVLLPGQTLVVHDPVRPHTFHGRGRPVSYTLDVWYYREDDRTRHANTPVAVSSN